MTEPAVWQAWIARVDDGSCVHLVEYTAPGTHPPERVACDVARPFMANALATSSLVIVELRREGERWNNERYRVRPALEAAP